MTTTSTTIFRATGKTLEEAVTAAHDKIPIPQHSDIVISRVVAWGMQTGGFIFQRTYWAELAADGSKGDDSAAH